MARKGENIYKRKDGRWEGRYLKCTPDGRKRYGYVYAKTYREVRSKQRQAAALWENMPKRGNGDTQSLNAAAEKWLASIGQQVRESTFVKYYTIVNKHLLPVLGEVCVEEMSHELIESHMLRLMREGGKNKTPLSPRTVSDVLSVLRSILRFARRGGSIVPCDGSSVRIRRPPVEIKALTRQEQDRLCCYLYRDLTPRNVGILLSLFMGLRVGEICALRWEDISLEDRLLYVRRTMHRIQNLDPEGPRTRVVITPPKSATSSRVIPMPEDLAIILLQMPGEHTGFFLTGREEAFAEPRIMQYHFRRTLERSEVCSVNYHVLRHTFATRCVELGFDIKSLSELLGHATVGMTMDRYVHPSLEYKRGNMRKLEEILPSSGTAFLTAKR